MVDCKSIDYIRVGSIPTYLKIIMYSIIKMHLINFFKNNFFNDFVLKLIFKKYMYNLYIYVAYFFAEKFIIEVNTRYIFNWILYYFNNSLQINLLPNLPLLIIGLFINYYGFYLLFM